MTLKINIKHEIYPDWFNTGIFEVNLSLYLKIQKFLRDNFKIGSFDFIDRDNRGVIYFQNEYDMNYFKTIFGDLPDCEYPPTEKETRKLLTNIKLSDA